MTATALRAALDLAGDGYAVFPVNTEKRPTLKGGFHNATSDPDAVRDLWRRGPGPLIGFATGAPSGVVVLDIDGPKHPEAQEWYLHHQHDLLPTRVNQTRSGGLHLLYTDPGGIGRRISAFVKGTDVLGNDGYAVWWPAAGCPVLSGAHAPAVWPQWLSEALEGQPTPTPPTGSISARAIAARPEQRGSAGRRLEGICRRLANAPEGQRNNMLNWAVWQVVHMELAPAGLAAAIEAIEATAVQIGLPANEIKRTIESARGAA
jgi:hypothetical protein